MKIITDNAVRTVTASSENPNYPASNLLNIHPKKKWQAADAAVSYAELAVSVAGKTGGLGMVGIVADSAVVSISDPSGIVWQNVTWQNVVWISPASDIQADIVLNKTGDYSTLWVEFPQFDAAVDIVIKLFIDSGSQETLAAGVIYAGIMIDIPGIEYGLQESLIDYSVIRQLSNGAEYIRRRDIVRTFSVHIMANRAKYFWKFMREIARKYGRQPLMYRLVDTVDGEWTVFARLSNMPTGVHSYMDYSEIDFEITEVL